MAAVEVSIQIPDFNGMSLQAIARAPLIIAATIQTQRGFIFDHEGQYNGHEKWEPLKLRPGQILKDTGTLSKSIGPRNDGTRPARSKGTILQAKGDMVTVGTDIKYADIHDRGEHQWWKKMFWAPIYQEIKKGKNKGGYRKAGMKLYFAPNGVIIPKRNFSKMTKEDVDELSETLANFYRSLI